MAMPVSNRNAFDSSPSGLMCLVDTDWLEEIFIGQKPIREKAMGIYNWTSYG
jgi:hypothetical protein